MNNSAMEVLEFNRIKEILGEYCISEQAKEKVKALMPSTEPGIIEKWMEETTQSKKVLSKGLSVPLNSLNGIDKVIKKLGKNSILWPEDLTLIAGLLKDSKRLKKFMADKDYVAPLVSSYALSIVEINDLIEDIERCIVNGRVDNGASSELNKIRKKIDSTEAEIKNKIDRILRSPAYKNVIQDFVVSQRSGRYVIPIKSEYKKNLEGSVLDTSTSGSTVFIEPKEVRKLQENLNLLRIQEEEEVYRILSTLTAVADGWKREISINIDVMVTYDFLFAKAKYSRYLEGNPVNLNTRGIVNIIKGKHPLIGKECVPLNFNIGEDYRALVITGPNTGGKTVAIKTVGLQTIMVQCGLHVPCQEGSEFAIFENILSDIGDGQSIEQSLSTFSSHIKNIISIIDYAKPNTLVIMDEVGSGTDPKEGQGLATSILEEVFKKGATIIATTHYGEIKDFASNTQGFKNGSMEFDIDTLMPKYRLNIGKPGESNAFLIALRLGMNKNIIERAHKITYGEQKEYQNYFEKTTDGKLENEEIKESFIANMERQIQKQYQKGPERPKQSSFEIGDCVLISTLNRTGIVYEAENSKGEVGVMVMKNKIKVNHKRLSLYVDSKELYPEDYDFDIVFESKEDRKKKHLMGKKLVKGLTIEHK